LADSDKKSDTSAGSSRSSGTSGPTGSGGESGRRQPPSPRVNPAAAAANDPALKPGEPRPPKPPRKLRPMPIPQPHPEVEPNGEPMLVVPNSGMPISQVVTETLPESVPLSAPISLPGPPGPEPEPDADVVALRPPSKRTTRRGRAAGESGESGLNRTVDASSEPAPTSTPAASPSNNASPAIPAAVIEHHDSAAGHGDGKSGGKSAGKSGGSSAVKPGGISAGELGDEMGGESGDEAGGENAGTGWGLDLEAGAHARQVGEHEHGQDDAPAADESHGAGYGYGEGDPPLSAPVPTLPGGPVRLSITKLLPQSVLRELQDDYWASSRHPAFIVDADGRPVLGNSPFVLDTKANLILNHLIDPSNTGVKGPVMFPIMADGQRVGSVAFDPRHLPLPLHVYRQKFAKFVASKGVKKSSDVSAIVHAAERVYAPNAGTAANMAIRLAEQLSRLCEQEVALRERIEELGTLGHMTTLLAGERDLSHRLNAAVRSAVAVLNVKAACIRILDDTNTLRVAAAYNLSREYMSQVLLEADRSPITRAAFAGEVVTIGDLGSDDRVVYQTRAVEEGLVSGMIVGLIYRNKPLGTFHVYTGEMHAFSRSAAKLFVSIAKLTASAIENWRRDSEVAENQRVQRQLKLATDVQRRMLPRTNPTIPGYEIDARYVPSFEIGGDFYDFINLGPNVGIAIGDVAGKGIAAGLLMAGVRSSLRAYAQDHYDIDQVMSRVNRSLAADTLVSEFATVFFGVLDPTAKRLTYCNAGHEPPYLLRNGTVTKLEEGGMVVGVDPEQVYKRGVAQLKAGDLLLFYTDGLPDAQNFDRKRFGKDRVLEALLECGNLSAKAAVSHLLWQMRRFVGVNHPSDDTTIVVIRVTE